MGYEDSWLGDLVEQTKLDREAALAKVTASDLSVGEKLGISMALKGISSLDGREEGAPHASAQLSKLREGVLLDPLDLAFIRTWLVYSKSLPVIEEEGGVEREDHEPEEKVGSPTLGVQLSLTAYASAEEGSNEDDAKGIEDD